MSDNRKWFSINSDALYFIVLLLVLFYSCVIMLFNPHTSSDRGCGAARNGMVDGMANSTADGTVDCASVLVSDLLSLPFHLVQLNNTTPCTFIFVELKCIL